MSTYELEDFISEAFFEDNVDFDSLTDVLDIYGEREETPRLDIDAAWERFRHNHYGKPEIYEMPEADNLTQTVSEQKPKNKKRVGRVKRIGLVAAIVVIFSIFTSTALGINIWEAIAHWTKDVFGFSIDTSMSSGKSMGDSRLTELETALLDNGLSIPIAPTWIPERFTLSEFYVEKMPSQTIFNAFYEYEDTSLTIQVFIFMEPIDRFFEKDDLEDVSIYERNSIEHYIMTNNGKTNAVWAFDAIKCYITGDISKADLEHIIDSIYER